jgi:hypothetical protein
VRLNRGEIRKECRIDLDHVADGWTSSEVADGIKPESGMKNERVIARVAGQYVIAGTAFDRVGIGITDEDVGKRAAAEILDRIVCVTRRLSGVLRRRGQLAVTPAAAVA